MLRGRYGDWDLVRTAQRAYAASPGSLLEREAAQLGLLYRLGRPRVHRIAGLRRGVLFTDVVAGATLAQLLCDEPRRTAELLGRTWVELRQLHQTEVAQRFNRSASIEERSTEGTFVRKFTGIGANAYLDRVATERHDDPGKYDDLITLLRRVVTRLARLSAMPPVTMASVLVYGDLKPEHIFFEHNTIASDGPVFIDPGLMRARATVDAAKLVSRTILLLIGFRPFSSKAIGDGLAAFVDDQIHALPAIARREWLRELVLLWLMDTVNILTTYLSAPASLPLPAHATAALSQAQTVGALLDKVSVEVAAGADPQSVWHLGLGDAVGHALSTATA
ncbi:MAG: phosphotransferase [Pseudonocardiaceae bacterium]